MVVLGMRIVVNGGQEDVDPGTTVSALVARHRLLPRYVAVEVNRELVPRAQYDSTTLSEGDHVEIVTLVGGG